MIHVISIGIYIDYIHSLQMCLNVDQLFSHGCSIDTKHIVVGEQATNKPYFHSLLFVFLPQRISELFQRHTNTQSISILTCISIKLNYCLTSHIVPPNIYC